MNGANATDDDSNNKRRLRIFSIISFSSQLLIPVFPLLFNKFVV